MTKRKEFTEYAAPGVHSSVLSVLSGKNGRLLDAGCGEGALIKRVTESLPGIRCTGTDFTRQYFKGGSPFFVSDLNKGIAAKNATFDIVCAVEVIEHLENKYLLLSEAHRVLKKGGTLILTTPNVESVYSRLFFLFTGRFYAFLRGDTDPRGKGPGMSHTSPTLSWELEKLAGGKFRIERRLFNRVRLPFLRTIIPTNSPLLGEINVFVMEKI